MYLSTTDILSPIVDNDIAKEKDLLPDISLVSLIAEATKPGEFYRNLHLSLLTSLFTCI